MTLNIRGDKTFSFVETTVTTIITPFQSAISSSITTVSDIWHYYFYLIGVNQENIKLAKQIEQLIETNSTYTEQNLQYHRLLKELDYKKELQKETLLAEVIGLDPSNWSQIVFINKGTSDGISKKMAVVNHKGVIGQTVHPTEHSSKMLLITDVRSAIDVLIQNSRSRGIAVGSNKNFCIIKYVPLAVEVAVGDRVVSSGLGGVFPKGLLVGFVKKIKKEKYGLFQYLELTPSADLSKLEEVLVITKK